MINTQSLKKKLIAIAKDSTSRNMVFPDDIDTNALADELLWAFMSTDSDLRDRLGMESFCSLVINGRISDEKCRSLLSELLSEKHLLCGLGKECDDSVFNRAFSTYGVGSIIEYNRKVDGRILTDDEVRDVLRVALKYFDEEVDLRGYVEVKGWAHSVAHAADLLAVLAEDRALGHSELFEMLVAIKNKVCIDYHSYSDEIFRLRNSVIAILRREILSEKEYADWIASFFVYEKTGDDLRDNRLRLNRSEFFLGISSGLLQEFPRLSARVWSACLELMDC